MTTLLPHKNNSMTINISQTCYNCWVITIAAVSTQFQEIWRQVADVVPCCGTVWVTGQVHTFPGCTPGCVGSYDRKFVCVYAM